MSENQPSEPKAIPMVPYLHLPESQGEEAYLVGSRCRNCGETYLGQKAICIQCSHADDLEEIALSRKGELFTYTVIYQSAPWVKVPYVAAVVKLPEGPVVRASLTGVEPDPEQLKAGMPVTMVTEKVREDSEGHEIVAYKFKPV